MKRYTRSDLFLALLLGWASGALSLGGLALWRQGYFRYGGLTLLLAGASIAHVLWLAKPLAT